MSIDKNMANNPINKNARFHIHFNSQIVDRIEKSGIVYRETDHKMGTKDFDFRMTADNKRQVIGLLKTIFDNCKPTDVHIYDTELFG